MNTDLISDWSAWKQEQLFVSVIFCLFAVIFCFFVSLWPFFFLISLWKLCGRFVFVNFKLNSVTPPIINVNSHLKQGFNNTAKTHGKSLTGRTLPHHPGLQTFLEAAGLTGFPPPLGDLTLVRHRAAVLDVA